MATAKKLPSGSWRCQVFSHYEPVFSSDGDPVIDSKTGKQRQKRIYESFTCDDPGPRGKRKAEAMAAAYAVEKEQKIEYAYSMTFGEALEKYITERSSVLSPASIRKYRSMQRSCMLPLKDYKLRDITQSIVQQTINTASASKSPKSVRDMNGLITAVIGRFAPDIHLKTVLPSKRRSDIYIPTDADIKKLLKIVRDTDMELPIMLAAFGAMRRGEICALSKSDFSGNIAHISKTMVYNEKSEWIIKSPKTYAGDRYVPLPAFVVKKFQALPFDNIDMTPSILTNRFCSILRRSGLPHFRFHDLRHYNASIQHAIGVPDAYIMNIGGWGNDAVLKSVYRHALPDVQKQMGNKTIKYFESMQHEMQHER